MMKVAVITALYYEDKYLPLLFSSLEKTDYPMDSWEIIMIDNKNSDLTKKWIKENVIAKIGKTLPTFRLLESEENLGFAGGNNKCMEKAIENGCQAVYLLNEDACGEPDFLKNAVSRLESDAQVGAVQSFLLLDGASKGLNSIGNCLHFLGFSYCDGYKMSKADASGLLRVRYLKDKELNIASASGAAVLLRTEALKKVGLFDESYHLYHEDLDLSLRLRESKYKVVIAPTSIVYHRYEFGRSAEKYFWMERNRYRLLIEHFRLATLLVLLPGLIITELGLLIVSLTNGTLKARGKIYAYFLNPNNWSEIFAKRVKVQEHKDVDDRDILASAVSSITYQEVGGSMLPIINKLMGMYWWVAKRVIYW